MKRPVRIKRQLFLCFIMFVAMVQAAVAENGDTESDAFRPATIGFVLPLSGEWAFLGNGIRDGALFAQEDLRSQGINMQLLFEDNRGDISTSVGITSQLLNVEKVSALVSIISGVANGIKPLASKKKVVSIGICSDTDVADGEYGFVNYLTAEQGVAKFLDHFRRTVGSDTSLGIFALNEDGFLRIVDELKQQAGGAPDAAFIEIYDKGTTDFRSVLVRSLKTKPDALLILGLSPEIELIARQAQSLGNTAPLVSIEGFGLAADTSPFEGAWFVDSAVPDEAFRRRFQEEYGREVTPGAGHAYDSVMLLARAFNGSRSPEEAAQRFRKIGDFGGVIGRLQVRSDGVIWSEASVKVIKNGHATLLEE